MKIPMEVEDKEGDFFCGFYILVLKYCSGDLRMRMRRKPNLKPRMEKCAHLMINETEKLRGKWLQEIPGFEKLYLELGCGKGKFTAETARTCPKILYIAIERVPDAMVIALERAQEAELENVRFLDRDAENLPLTFGHKEVNRIYINFCDPWPSNKHAKRRLTSGRFLKIYQSILTADGEIHFKTDNLPLFEYSLKQFTDHGFALSEVTRNLHEDGETGIMTDYEVKFHKMGICINRCVAKINHNGCAQIQE